MDDAATAAAEDDDEEEDGLPATMADMFLALVAVVLLMLLSLVPLIRAPGALAPAEPVWERPILVDGVPAATFLAESGGVRVDPAEASGPSRLVPLDGVLADAPLRAALEAAQAAGRPLLLLVRPDGGEAAFLFDAVAAAAGVPSFEQLRIDRACRLGAGGTAVPGLGCGREAAS